jgi:hypothetical protein
VREAVGEEVWSSLSAVMSADPSGRQVAPATTAPLIDVWDGSGFEPRNRAATSGGN